eukprot:284553_1
MHRPKSSRPTGRHDTRRWNNSLSLSDEDLLDEAIRANQEDPLDGDGKNLRPFDSAVETNEARVGVRVWLSPLAFRRGTAEIGLESGKAGVGAVALGGEANVRAADGEDSPNVAFQASVHVALRKGKLLGGSLSRPHLTAHRSNVSSGPVGGSSDLGFLPLGEAGGVLDSTKHYDEVS